MAMATIKDVAKAAGVSITTVSRALNGYSDINDDTKKKIMDIASQLNYRPNAIARSLVKKESRIFGYIVSGLEKGAKHNIISDSMCGIYEFTRSVDYEILMFAVDSDMQHTKSYIQFAKEHSLAGIILQGIRSDDEYYRDILYSQIPCVLIDLPADSVRVGSVSTDNYKASLECIEYLTSKGHSNIAFINGKDAAVVSRVRYEGYIAKLREKGLPIRMDYILSGNFSEDEAYRCVIEFLPEHPEVTAIFCASDLMAIGAIRAAQTLGRSIPSELAVMGFDDILISSYVTPSLSTVHQDFNKMGFEAAKMLYAIISGQDVPHTINVDYELMIRDSTS